MMEMFGDEMFSKDSDLISDEARLTIQDDNDPYAIFTHEHDDNTIKGFDDIWLLILSIRS